MSRYRIHAVAEGTATVEVEADSEDEAIETAYREHLTGIQIDGGVANWEVEGVEEVEDES